MLRQSPFSEYPGSKAMLCNFQCVQFLDIYVKQDDGRKSGDERQNSKKGFEKNEHACSMDYYGGSFCGL